MMFDARSGERLALFPGSVGLTTAVRPDLRAMVVASSTNWDLRPLPSQSAAHRRRASPPRFGRRASFSQKWRSSQRPELVATCCRFLPGFYPAPAFAKVKAGPIYNEKVDIYLDGVLQERPRTHFG